MLAFLLAVALLTPTAGLVPSSGLGLGQHSQRRCGPVVAKTKRKAVSKGKAKTKPANAFSLKHAMEDAMHSFREVCPTDLTRERSRDVYVRAEGSPKYFFVGKATGSGIEAAGAILSQKRVVLEHAKLLDQELRTADLQKVPLQIWTAPLGTEVAVAQRDQALTSLASAKLSAEERQLVSSGEARAGFEPEQIADNETGFHVKLPSTIDEDGVLQQGVAAKATFVAPGSDALADIDLANAQVVT